VWVFKQDAWLGVGSVKMAFSRPPMLRNTPKGHNANRWAPDLSSLLFCKVQGFLMCTDFSTLEEQKGD
jgi:hypothetical protein